MANRSKPAASAASAASTGPLSGFSSGTPIGTPIGPEFFARDAQVVACDLLGKVIRHEVGGFALMASIIEAEAYYLEEKASHASLGFTEKRKPLFMPPGTIYMYYARGGDSFNVSCAGEGNAVLVKAGIPFSFGWDADLGAASKDGTALLGAVLKDGAVPLGENAMTAEMRRRNPLPSGRHRPLERLCSGQTLLCRALGLRVPQWSGIAVGTPPLTLLDVGYRPGRVLRTTRLGIPPGRDGHLPYRFVDAAFARQATKNPLPTQRGRGGTGRSAPSGSVIELKVPPGRKKVNWANLLR